MPDLHCRCANGNGAPSIGSTGDGPRSIALRSIPAQPFDMVRSEQELDRHFSVGQIRSRSAFARRTAGRPAEPSPGRINPGGALSSAARTRGERSPVASVASSGSPRGMSPSAGPDCRLVLARSDAAAVTRASEPRDEALGDHPSSTLRPHRPPGSPACARGSIGGTSRPQAAALPSAKKMSAKPGAAATLARRVPGRAQRAGTGILTSASDGRNEAPARPRRPPKPWIDRQAARTPAP